MNSMAIEHAPFRSRRSKDHNPRSIASCSVSSPDAEFLHCECTLGHAVASIRSTRGASPSGLPHSRPSYPLLVAAVKAKWRRSAVTAMVAAANMAVNLVKNYLRWPCAFFEFLAVSWSA